MRKPLTKKAKIIIWVISIVLVLAIIGGSAFAIYYFHEPEVDFNLDEFLAQATLVFEDNFDGNELNTDIWFAHGSEHESGKGERHGGYWAADAVSVENGHLIIETTYRDDDGDGEPDYFYTGAVDSKHRVIDGKTVGYESKYGYYEARIKFPHNGGIWSCFWMMPGYKYGDAFGKGDNKAWRAGAEIDIAEVPAYPKNAMQPTVHIGGYGRKHVSFYPLEGLSIDRGDIYSEFHTYGMYWDENVYIFFYDGEPIWSMNKRNAVSQVEEYLFFSTEIGGKKFGELDYAWNNPMFGRKADDERNDWTIHEDGHTVAQLQVDYVRRYVIE